MFIGHDQYGTHYSIKSHPRAELLTHLGRKHADRMYCDRDGVTYHVGYIIAGHWINVFGLEGKVFAKPA